MKLPRDVEQILEYQKEELAPTLSLDRGLDPTLYEVEVPDTQDETAEEIIQRYERRRQEAIRAKAVQRLLMLKQESLRIYEPMPHIEEFHKSRAPQRILRGSNRSGKTLGAAVEMARAVTAQDPYKKYPLHGGRAFIVGKDGKHNSEVLYRKLFRPNAFRVITDENTHLTRSFRPWDEKDMAREHEARAADPLIPERFVKDVAWENKRESLPNVVTLTTGWEIRFFSSLAKPPQGSDVDLVWFDEEIVDPEWYSEVAARGTVDRRGRFYWSATAQKGGLPLYELCQKAEEQRHRKKPRIQEFFAHLDHNRHFTDEQREAFAEDLTDEERLIRIGGEFAFLTYRVYPEYQERVHGIASFPIPSDWCKYMIVDPGRQVCAVMFAAIPPPELKDDSVYIYDELYLKQCNSILFGEEVGARAREQSFHAFLIDSHEARKAQTGDGRTIETQYAEALRKENVSSLTTGNGFYWASDDVSAGINAVRNWMVIRGGKPKLQVMREKCPNFEWEIKRYHYKRVKNMITDQPEQRNNHLMDCLRYLAMYEPQYHKPKAKGKMRNGILRYLAGKQEKQRERDENHGVLSLG